MLSQPCQNAIDVKMAALESVYQREGTWGISHGSAIPAMLTPTPKKPSHAKDAPRFQYVPTWTK